MVLERGNRHKTRWASPFPRIVPRIPMIPDPREASGCWSADGRRHIQLGSLRDLDRSPPRGCRYHQDPSRTCTGCAVASGISFACPSSSMAIVQKLLPIRRTDFSPQIRGHSNSLVVSPSNYSLQSRCPCCESHVHDTSLPFSRVVAPSSYHHACIMP
jgi:hypothetical protein